ncbi:MAG TPA: hypothetical protein VN775_04820 [Opitutaceae bacterium]|nr:hypothetical protein [Opitutaceae bacterium]
MSLFARILPRAWIILPICGCGYLAWSGHVRMQHVEFVSGLVGRARPVDVPDAASPTGYANGQRELIVPERNESSFHWIAQTQQMLARGEARVRHVDYENAPFGREVSSASPYRWWLGFVAWLDHASSGRPLGMSVERGALLADPLLQLLLVGGAAVFAAWQFGGYAAALLSVGLVAIFPFASGFLPGMPDQRGLGSICAFASILAVLAGMNPRPPAGDGDRGAGADRRARRWFALAGVVGGLGVWISVPTQVPVTAGLVFGAVLAAWTARHAGAGTPAAPPLAAPWRTWGFCGGVTVLAAYLAEYFPDHLGSWRLASVHPLYGLAWICGGELLARSAAWIQGERPARSPGAILVAVAALAGVAAVPLVMWRTGDPGFLARDPSWARLSGLPNGPVAASLGDLLLHGGSAAAVWATLLPLTIAVPAVWLLMRPSTGLQSRASVSVALGPVLVALGFSFAQLSWWSVLDGALLAMLVACAAGEWTLVRASGRWLLAPVVLAFAIPDMAQTMPRRSAESAATLTPRESEELVARHLGHWLANRAGEPGIVVFAPPDETTTLCFFGGFRGIGSFAPDNSAGFANTLAIAGARTMEEAQASLQGRGVRFIIVPSWDPFFDEFARRYLDKRFSNRQNLLVGELRRWNLPLWVRAVPYQMPVGGGFEGQSVLVFEVVDEQSPAAATGRLAEYLVETGRLENAAIVREGLRRFPGDVGALAALAQVEKALGDEGAFAKTLESLLARLSNRGDRFLPWDRRVSLAIVLTQGRQIDLARDQVRRCLADVNEGRLRSLSAGSLYDLLVLGRTFGLGIADPKLREIALNLLPGDLRGGL